MNKLFISIAIMTIATTDFAQSEQETVSSETAKNSWGAKLIESNFHLGLDLQTKYIWRGMEMMTDEAAPVLFPRVNYYYPTTNVANDQYFNFKKDQTGHWLEAVVTIAPEKIPVPAIKYITRN